MNLLGKFNPISKFVKPGIIALIPVFLGCETSEDIGIQYELDSNANIRFIEFALPATNIYVDSLRTDGENSIISGTYNDLVGGEVDAEGYFQFFYENGPLPRATASDEVPNPPDTLQLDSVIISLETSSSIPFTGSFNQELKLFTLTDSLISNAIYLSSLQLDKDQEIGSFSGMINPEVDSVIQFGINSSFASELFDLIGDINEDVNQSIFASVFQSLALVSSAGSEGINLFDLTGENSRIYLYSSPDNLNARDTTYTTSFLFSGKNFSHINRANSNLGLLEDGDEIPTSDDIIIDPLYGISPRISLADLADFFDANERIIINNASITFGFEETAERDTLLNFYSFFYKQNGFNAPGLINDPFASLVMSDNAYLTRQNSPAISVLNSDSSQLIVNATLFFQTLYIDYLENSEISQLLVTDNVTQEISLVDLITLSLSNVNLQRTTFDPENIRLKVFYTDVE